MYLLFFFVKSRENHGLTHDFSSEIWKIEDALKKTGVQYDVIDTP